MDHDIAKLINQCKSQDVDVRVDAVTRLQQAFEAGLELNDKEELIAALKSCLRTPNQHLITATLSALPPLFPLLVSGSHDASVDVLMLKQALLGFISSGGIIDRLGDSRERAREKARESMTVLGSLAFGSNTSQLHSPSKLKEAGKGQETPLTIWERAFKGGGLQSKVWRVREQALLILVELRRLHPSFPLRPYLSNLVETLEDTDGTVRECARQSIVELFSGPGVTDAARADLKKEMAKKGVRRTIVESVLLKLLASGTNSASASDGGSEIQDMGRKDDASPSMVRRPTAGVGMSRVLSQSTAHSSVENLGRSVSRVDPEFPTTPQGDASDVPAIYIASSKDLENEFARMLPYFQGKETEHNWASRERSIVEIRGMLKGEAHQRYTECFLTGLKDGILEATFKTLASLRTTLCTNTCLLYSELALKLGTLLDPFCESILSHLLRMAGFTKKIAATQSQSVVSTFFAHTSAHPRLIPQLLWNMLQDKNVQARSFMVSHIKTYLEIHGQKSNSAIEASGASEILEKSVKKALADANPNVREKARITFWVFQEIWKQKGAAIMETLDTTARKQLEKACPNPQGQLLVSTETPNVRKSSVAAAIAASRAKARAIAVNPPTLRHQATSTSHAVYTAATPPPARSPSRFSRPSSPATSSRSVSMSSIRHTPPASPMRRISSMSPPRVLTSGLTSITHGRSRSVEASPPPSPTVEAAHKRRVTSLTSLGFSQSLDAAIQTPLPASPPRSHHVHSPPVSPGQNYSNITSLLPIPVTHRVRSRLGSLIALDDGDEQSLLLATTIPIPEDSDSDADESNMLSFSAPYEMYAARSKTTLSNPSTSSPPPSAPQVIVEDALRARAEQAESTAERLLELVEPDDDSHVSPIPHSLIVSKESLTRPRGSARASAARPHVFAPRTEQHQRSALLEEEALFQDSSVNRRGSRLVDALRERKRETGWWLKRMSLASRDASLLHGHASAKPEDLVNYIAALEENTAGVHTLKNLALLCMENPVNDIHSPKSSSYSYPLSPSPKQTTSTHLLTSNMWTVERQFDHMLNALLRYLQPAKNEEMLEFGLIVLWEVLENQGPLIEGFEGDICVVLLRVRYCNNANVLDATNAIRDALIANTEPVYGLTTLHASLRTFITEAIPPNATSASRSASYAFGLIAVGKFMLKLPAEILEDELPRLKSTLITALNDTSSLVVRESAAAALVAAQLVLGDETHLFTLLDGLADEKKNLLAYLFDKHGARGQNNTKKPSGVERLEKEMLRLDGRTNAPPRINAAH